MGQCICIYLKLQLRDKKYLQNTNSYSSLHLQILSFALFKALPLPHPAKVDNIFSWEIGCWVSYCLLFVLPSHFLLPVESSTKSWRQVTVISTRYKDQFKEKDTWTWSMYYVVIMASHLHHCGCGEVYQGVECQQQIKGISWAWVRAGLRAAQISLQAWQSHDESQKQDCSFRRIDCGGPSIPFYTPAKCNLPEVIKGLTFLWAGSTVMLPGLSVFSYYQRILFYPLLSAPFSAGYMNVCSPSTEKKYIRPFFLSNNILVPQAWIASNFLSQNIDKGQGRQNLVEVSGGQVMKPHVECWVLAGVGAHLGRWPRRWRGWAPSPCFARRPPLARPGLGDQSVLGGADTRQHSSHRVVRRGQWLVLHNSTVCGPVLDVETWQRYEDKPWPREGGELYTLYFIPVW